MAANGIVYGIRGWRAGIILSYIAYAIAYTHSPFQLPARNDRDHQIRIQAEQPAINRVYPVISIGKTQAKNRIPCGVAANPSCRMSSIAD